MEKVTQTKEPQARQTQQQISDLHGWASLIGSGALVISGLSERPLRSVLIELAGGHLADRGATDIKQSIRVEKTVTIAKSPEELYHFWRNFENLPRFMKHIKSVKVYDNKRSHWIADAPLGNSMEWDADIVKEEENKLIAWISVEGQEFDNSGFVRFLPAPGDRGTEVKLVMEYYPPGGVIGAAVAKLFGEEPEQQISEDLRRFKQLMEAGEIATTEGQPSCRK